MKIDDVLDIVLKSVENCNQNTVVLTFVVELRNKFHFSEVHGSMNSTGHVQSKWRPKGVTLSLHGTLCFLTSISYIYTLFLHRFCSLFVEFLFKSCK